MMMVIVFKLARVLLSSICCSVLLLQAFLVAEGGGLFATAYSFSLLPSSMVTVNGFSSSPTQQQKQQQQQQQQLSIHPSLFRRFQEKQKLRHSMISSRLYGNRNHKNDYNESEDEDDDDDDEPPEIDSSKLKNFQPSTVSFGWNRGRSSPSLRKAMGRSNLSKAKVYVCTNCGSESVKWLGRCPTCKEWNTLKEFQVSRSNDDTNGSLSQALLSGRSVSSSSSISSLNGIHHQSWLDGIDDTTMGGNDANDEGSSGGLMMGYTNRPISITKIIDRNDSSSSRRLRIPDDEEFTNVLGGGFMPGSLILLGGDPGVGKSTLALQIGSQLASSSSSAVWYVSGEETLGQVAARAERLDAHTIQQLYLFAETNLNHLAELILLEMEKLSSSSSMENYDNNNNNPTTTSSSLPGLLIIDSLQTMVCDTSSNYATGGIAQVRECMALLLRLAKLCNIPILVIGHVTKSGDVAGPRMVEHMVDAVLYLEHGGNNQNQNTNYRWLRAVKNRFGSCDTVGLYSFEQDGYLQPSPESFDLMQQQDNEVDNVEGCAMAIAIEGNQRAMIVEVQALVVVTDLSCGSDDSGSGGSGGGGGGSKTTVEGSSAYRTRIQLLLGVLKKHCRIYVQGRNQFTNIFLNIISNLSKSKQRTLDPTLDLAVVVAITSSLKGIPVRSDTAFLAQVGLLGELRTLSNMEIRLSQAHRMGFRRVIVAGNYNNSKKSKKKKSTTLQQQQPYYSGMEVLEYPTLKQALEAGLTAPIPKKSNNGRRRQQQQKEQQFKTNKTSRSKGDPYIILDDEDDDVDDDDYFYDDFQ